MRNVLILGLFLVTSIVHSQVAQINGQVLDAEFNDEPLAFAEVKVKGLDLQAITDENGNYELQLAPGSYNLEIAFIGYEPHVITAEVNQRSKRIELDPVVLEGRKHKMTGDLSLMDEGRPSNEE